MMTKTMKLLILSFVVFTLLLNLINLSFAINYENTHAKHDRILISGAGNNISDLKEACLSINSSTEQYLFYKKNIIWSFITIIISIVAIFIEFALAKSKIILFSPKDWKHLRTVTFTAFLSIFIFVYTFWILANDSYLGRCLNI